MKAAYHPDEVIATVAAARGQYIAVFLGVLVLTYGFFLVIDFVPEAPDEATATISTSTPGGTEIAHAAGEEDAQGLPATTSDMTVAEENNEQEPSTADVIPADQPEEPSSVEEDTSALVTVPEPTAPIAVDTEVDRPTASALPVRIEIDALDRVVPVLNPTSRNVNELDTALLSGVVRHPDAANFNQDANMFILGHSSRLPNVINKNFQAFNDIETLQWGDVIRVYSTDTVYVYRVDTVYEAKASIASVPIAGTGKMLTLATCNSFGSVDDRHIVEAKLVSQQAL